jgi:hypothetical protein
MEHKLRILIRLDIDRSSAVLAVNGCLTVESYKALLPVIRRASALVGGLRVIVDLRNALHVEAAAADALNDSVSNEYRHHDVGMVTVQYPGVFPSCALLAGNPSLHKMAVG